MRPRGATLSFIPIAVITLLVVAFLALPIIRVPNTLHPYETVLVLGAAQYAGQPSPALQRRLDHALALYKGGKIQRIVVSGGRRKGDPYTEGGVGITYLNQRGIPVNALLAEESSRTTIQNLQNTKKLLPPATPITLVTDETHAPRALALARALGITANISASRLKHGPSLQYILREKVALAGYALIGLKL